MLFLSNRRDARREAASLISEHGEKAPQAIRMKIADALRAGDDVAALCRVKVQIDRILKSPPHLDTATRYIEG